MKRRKQQRFCRKPPIHSQTARPKFLGTIVQKYRLRSQGTPSTAFQKWIDEVQDKVAKKLVPVLTAAGMMLPSDTYKLAGMKVGEPLLQMSDFNGLIAQSRNTMRQCLLSPTLNWSKLGSFSLGQRNR